MRKIVQIASAWNGGCDALYALCDDGTVWRRSAMFPEWERLSDIPQEASNEH